MSDYYIVLFCVRVVWLWKLSPATSDMARTYVRSESHTTIIKQKQQKKKMRREIYKKHTKISSKSDLIRFSECFYSVFTNIVFSVTVIVLSGFLFCPNQTGHTAGLLHRRALDFSVHTLLATCGLAIWSEHARANLYQRLITHFPRLVMLVVFACAHIS